MRPFERWSVRSLELGFDQTVIWLKNRLVSFGTSWEPRVADLRLAQLDDLLGLAHVLATETRRLEELADELLLRRHWSVGGRARSSPDENWRIERAGDSAHYVREAAQTRPGT